MAFGSVVLPPHLAPWQHVGVQWLLADAPLPPELGLCADPQKAQTVRRVARLFASGDAGQSTARATPHAPHTEVQRSAPPAERYTAGGARAAQPASTGSASPARDAVQSRSTGTPADGNPAPQDAGVVRLQSPFVPPEHWPPLWQERMRVTSPAPVLWTYWELGTDFCGTPDAARRSLLQRLLKDMGHPAGTHKFWPCALPAKQGDADLLADAAIFWSGVRQLKARVIVAFGQQTFEAMGVPAIPPLRVKRTSGGQRLISLYDVHTLVDNPAVYNPVVSFLRSHLRTFGA